MMRDSVMSRLSINKKAVKIVEEMMEKEDVLNIKCIKTNVGTTLIDCGVEVKGGYQAGIYVSKVCLGGLASINLSFKDYNGVRFPIIEEFIDHPIIACMASQYAGWRIKYDNYTALGSGPARALALKPKKLFKKIGYVDHSDEAVLVLEASKYPPGEVMLSISENCNVNPRDLYILVVPSNSLAGSVQISSRIVETGIHRLEVLGFDINKIVCGAGMCPIAPLHPDPTIMMGRTNDALIYTGEVHLYTYGVSDNELSEIIAKVPSSTSSCYGTPFYEIFKAANFDFYKVDPNIFAPAFMVITNMNSGRVFKAGRINVEVLSYSWGLQ